MMHSFFILVIKQKNVHTNVNFEASIYVYSLLILTCQQFMNIRVPLRKISGV